MQIRGTRETELLNFGARSGLLLEKQLISAKPKSFRLPTQVGDSAPALLSASDLCGNFVAATEVNPPQQIVP